MQSPVDRTINLITVLIVLAASILVHLVIMNTQANNPAVAEQSNLSIDRLNELSSASQSSWSTGWRLVSRPVILAVDDSLTQKASMVDGYVTILNNLYSRKADVINRGYSGYNSDWMVTLIDRFIETNAWPFAENQLVILCLGANDAVFADQKQHVPLDRYKSNMIQLVEKLTSRKAQLLLVTPPATDPPAWARFQQERDQTPELHISRSVEQTSKYAQTIRDIGKELNIPVVDAFKLLTSKQSPNPYLCDGLHYNTQGNAMVFEAIVQAINANFPQWNVEQMMMDAPHHTELAAETYSQTLKQTGSK